MVHKTLAFALLACPPLAVAAVAYIACGTSLRVGIALGCLSAFCFCDAWYFVRMAQNALALWVRDQAFAQAFLPPAAPPRALFDTSTLTGRVLLNDIDRNGHYNNARYLRECGFGRRDLWQCNGVWTILRSRGGNLVVGSQTVRFRRELSLGQAYALETRVLCWDARAFYVEHRFVTPAGADTRSNSTATPFVHAIVLVKNTVLGPLSPQALVAALAQQNHDANEPTSPAMPPDVAAWIASNDLSSKQLRAESIVNLHYQ